MEVAQGNDIPLIDKRFENILKCLTKCKMDFLTAKEECKRLRDCNNKLEIELKETRELEKSNRYHLLSSREMIANLQETVSQLVYLKRDVKKLKTEILSKNNTIAALKKEINGANQKHEENLMVLKNEHEKYSEDVTLANEKKIQQMQLVCDTQVAELSCIVEEFRSKIEQMEVENRDKMNAVVLEYEEKIQRGSVQVCQLQEQLAIQTASNDANIKAYRRRLEELEEKLKQSQFKQYVAQNIYSSQHESQVERPYSVNSDPYTDASPVDVDPVLENAKRKPPTNTQNKSPKANKLQVMYYGAKNPNRDNPCDNKSLFKITKKRKLYSEKDFQNV